MKDESRDYGKENNLNLRIVIGFARNFLKLERAAQRMLTGFDLTLTQFSVLETLYHLGSMRINLLIEKTLTTAGNMTVVIKNLEKGGLISRYTDPNDKRASMIRLTQKGEQLIAVVFPKHLENLSLELNNLTSDEKEQLVFLLKKLSGRSS